MDFNDFVIRDPSKPKKVKTVAGENKNRRWWMMETGQEQINAITTTLNTLIENQRLRLTQYLISGRFYGNLPMMGAAGVSFSKLASSAPGVKDRLTYNAIQIATDTAVAKVRKNRPKPYFLTSGADYKTQRRAKNLNKFIDGVFYELGIDIKSPEAFRDGSIWGDGVVHIFPKDERVCAERVFPHELWVDEIEAFYRDPRQLHRMKNVDRDVLADEYPDCAEAIRLCDNSSLADVGTQISVADMVTVRESWHLPSGDDAEDGLHIITIANKVLFSEPWTVNWFPFVRFPWCPRLYGYWSQGGAEQAQNLQLEINQTLWVIQRSFKLAGSFKIFAERGSRIVAEHLNNDIGTMVEYTGTQPSYVVPPVVPGETWQHLRDRKQEVFEIYGVSQMSARSEKPAGLNSGIALREYKDETAERLLTPSQNYEQFHLDLARLCIETIKMIAKASHGHYKVTTPGRKWLETIDWANVSMDEDQYSLKCYPVSQLPSDPAGRLATIQDYVQAGFISPRQGKRLLDFPDLERLESLQNASEDYLSFILDKIVDEGVLTPPEPFDDLQLAREMALEYYQQGKSGGLEEERLELLRRFLAQVAQLQVAANPPAPAPVVGTPQAAPMPTPTSGLIPNVPTA